jgi:predicted RNase H-like nuclease (RuvC/YqgF family)
MMSLLYCSFEDVLSHVVLGQALNNPRSSIALNEWMDEKLENRMEAFASVNRFLRDSVEKAENKVQKLEEQNAELRAKLEVEAANRIVSEHLRAHVKRVEERNEQLLQEILKMRS